MTYAQLFEKLRHKPMTKAQFELYVKNIGGLYAELEVEMQLLLGSGAPLRIEEHNGEPLYTLSTLHTPLERGIFVFVDIESNGSKPESSEIIEIGALKVRYKSAPTQHKKPASKGKTRYENVRAMCLDSLRGELDSERFEILGRFESYVYASQVPESITELTGIRFEDIKDAPRAKEVLRDFREFLGESVFVAHNVNFDYKFLDFHLRQLGLFPLLNPKLCTLDLSRRTIPSPRHGLSFLNDFLALGAPLSHRAYADALTSFRLFEITTMMFPREIQSVQDLIDFSRGRIGYAR